MTGEKLPCKDCKIETGCGDCNISGQMYDAYNPQIIHILEGEEIEYIVSKSGCKSSLIDIKDGKIVNIVFIFNNKEYRIYFDYTFSPLHNTSLRGNESKKPPIKNNIIISDLEIQEKVKCEYSELTPISTNNKFIKFIEKVLLKYHNS